VGPDISAARAPAGDIATAIMDIDSTLRRIHAAGGGGSAGLSAEDMIETEQRARDVLNGYCTVIYLFLACRHGQTTCRRSHTSRRMGLRAIRCSRVPGLGTGERRGWRAAAQPGRR
jgi:hypothetical protein